MPGPPVAVRPAARMVAMRKLLVVLLAVVLAGSVAATAHVAWHSWKPAGDDARVAAQVAFLHEAIDDGAGPRMQEFFPEGEFFTAVLTGMAAANVGRRDDARRDWALTEVHRALAVAESDRVTAPFGKMAFEHGIFWRGWRAQLLVDRAMLSGTREDIAAAKTEASAIGAALAASRTGFVESYPGQYWPCDSVVAMSAVARADHQWGLPGFSAVRDLWLEKLSTSRDPNHGGLLVHRVDATGKPIDGVRGTSQSIIQSFWPDIDPASASSEWEAFRTHLMTRELGLVGVREYPRDVPGQAGDVDSGPLVLGVSLSASATTLAAARRNGDLRVAAALDHEAEVFGVPFGAKERRFALGLMPVGDAFVAWARSVEVRPDTTTRTPEQERTDSRLRPVLWAWALAVAVPGLAAALGIAQLVRRTRATTPSAPAPFPPR